MGICESIVEVAADLGLAYCRIPPALTPEQRVVELLAVASGDRRRIECSLPSQSQRLAQCLFIVVAIKRLKRAQD